LVDITDDSQHSLKLIIKYMFLNKRHRWYGLNGKFNVYHRWYTWHRTY